MNTTVKYTIRLEGNDIDTKKVQKLKPGSSLLLKRVNDAEDTFEICVCHSDGREIDMLSYAESIGVVPFIDDELVTAAATVDSVQVKPGKSRAKDLTILTVNVEYSFEENLETVQGENGFGFIDSEDIILTLTTLNSVLGDKDMPVERPYLNLYTMDLPLGEKAKDYFDYSFARDETYLLAVKALFNESFTKCRISAALCGKDGEEKEVIELDENEKQTVLTLVNHARIFEGEEGVNREIDN